MRQIYLPVFITLTFLAGICAAQSEKKTVNAATSSAIEQPKVQTIGVVKIINKSVDEKNDRKMFEIRVDYPELTGVKPEIAAEFNSLTEDFAMKQVREFRKTMLAQTEEDLSQVAQRGFDNYLDVDYQLAAANERIITVVFANSIFDGGAMANQFSHTINFDLKTGKKLELSDIFKPNSNYLKVLSDFSMKNLKVELEDLSDEEWLENGASARAENFDSWNVTKKGLVINFDPYQIAAYAAGPRQVLIPYSELKNLLSENAPVLKP